MASSRNKDSFHNRTRLFWALNIFAVMWAFQLIWLDAILMNMSAGKATAYLGVPEIIAGLNNFSYHRACSEAEND